MVRELNIVRSSSLARDRSVGGRPSWKRTPLDDYFELAISRLMNERGMTQPELARRMTFVQRELAKWRAQKAGAEFIELPEDMPLAERRKYRAQVERDGKNVVVWHSLDNAVTTQTAFDAIHLKTQPTVGRVYELARAFNVPISALFSPSDWKPALDEKLAAMWENLTEEQRFTLYSLAEMFVQKNVAENTKALVES